MLSFFVPHELGGEFPATTQIWRAPLCIVGICCQNVDAAFAQHPFGPVFRISAEMTNQRARRNLHPDTGANKPLDRCIALVDPR